MQNTDRLFDSDLTEKVLVELKSACQAIVPTDWTWVETYQAEEYRKAAHLAIQSAVPMVWEIWKLRKLVEDFVSALPSSVYDPVPKSLDRGQLIAWARRQDRTPHG